MPAILTIFDTIGALPLSVRRALGRCAGLLFSFLPTRDRLVATRQVECFLPTVSASSVVRGVYAHVGQVFMESINLFPLLQSPEKYVSCPEWPLAQSLLAQKRPIVALTAHTGNWDLLGAYWASQGVPLTTIGREARNKGLQYALLTLRDRYRIKTIWRSRSAGAKEIVNVLKSGEVIAGLLDQDTRVRSAFAPFFGRPVSVPTTLIELGMKHDAIFVSTFIFRESRGCYRIYLETFPDNANPENIIIEFNRRLEALIRQYPDQWVWFHKRWRTLPSGERVSGRRYAGLLRDWKLNAPTA